MEIALLDAKGVIVWVNSAWRAFTAANGGDPASAGPGVSYLDICACRACSPSRYPAIAPTPPAGSTCRATGHGPRARIDSNAISYMATGELNAGAS